MTTTEYHKIQTVWNRDPDTKFKTLIPNSWAKPEFEYLRDLDWTFTEKVDGTNIRIIISDGKASIGGKTNDAQIPATLIGRLREIGEKAIAAGIDEMVLYGEGFGAKIQKGGGSYIKDRADFVLFDVFSIVGRVWLRRDSAEDIAANLAIGVVPIIGRGPLHHAIEIARVGFNSTWGPFSAEGLVMRPSVELFDRMGDRIITKIKTKDFTADQRTLSAAPVAAE